MECSYFGMMPLHLVKNEVVRVGFDVLGDPVTCISDAPTQIVSRLGFRISRLPLQFAIISLLQLYDTGHNNCFFRIEQRDIIYE